MYNMLLIMYLKALQRHHLRTLCRLTPSVFFSPLQLHMHTIPAQVMSELPLEHDPSGSPIQLCHQGTTSVRFILIRLLLIETAVEFSTCLVNLVGG